MEQISVAVESWLEQYRRFMQVPLFLDAYRTEQERRGESPQQNFLIGSGLLGNYEVEWCKVLAWLLNPRSCATLAMEFQKKVCKNAGFVLGNSDRAFEVARERFHPGGESRYDIELKRNDRVFLIEAKVGAPVEKDQLDRYCEEHSHCNFCGLLVTVDRHEDSLPGKWQCCRWRDISEHLRKLLQEQIESKRSSTDERRWALVAEDFVNLISHEQI